MKEFKRLEPSTVSFELSEKDAKNLFINQIFAKTGVLVDIDLDADEELPPHLRVFVNEDHLSEEAVAKLENSSFAWDEDFILAGLLLESLFKVPRGEDGCIQPTAAIYEGVVRLTVPYKYFDPSVEFDFTPHK